MKSILSIAFLAVLSFTVLSNSNSTMETNSIAFFDGCDKCGKDDCKGDCKAKKSCKKACCKKGKCGKKKKKEKKEAKKKS